MDQYTFTERFNNEAGLVGDLASARELLAMFANSPREFEVIFVRTVDCPTPATQQPGYLLLGYDVAGMAPAVSTLFYWDSTLDREEFGLNEDGLFTQCEEAKRYRDSRSEFHKGEFGTQYIWEIYYVGAAA